MNESSRIKFRAKQVIKSRRWCDDFYHLSFRRNKINRHLQHESVVFSYSKSARCRRCFIQINWLWKFEFFEQNESKTGACQTTRANWAKRFNDPHLHTQAMVSIFVNFLVQRNFIYKAKRNWNESRKAKKNVDSFDL